MKTMQRYARIGSVILTAAALIGCSDKLTRPKALEMLKESAEEELPQRTVSVRTDIWIPDPDVENKTERLLARQFFEALQAKGLLSGPTTRPHQLVWTPGTDYFFWTVEQPEVAASQSANLTLNASKGTITEVTGILSEGADLADVDCVAIYSPTEIFKTVNSFVVSYKQLGQRWLNGYLFSGWPEAQELYTKEVRRYRFRKYDDGWRVEGFIGTSGMEIIPQPPEELDQATVPVPTPAPISVAAPVLQETNWEVPSLGNYSDGYYQLELWRDKSSGGQVIGLISMFSEDVSQNPSVGELTDLSGNGEHGVLRFKSKLPGEEISFDGSIQGSSIEGAFRSSLTPEVRQASFNRLERQYEENYATKRAWSARKTELLDCCGPAAKKQ